MVNQLNYSVYTLEPGEACALPRRARLTVCALEQPLWLSQQGRLDDVIVSGGDCVTLPGHGLVVAQAFARRTSFRVACAASPGERFIARMRRTLASLTGPAASREAA